MPCRRSGLKLIILSDMDRLLNNATAATDDHEVLDFQHSEFSPLLDRLDSAERGTAWRERIALLRPANQHVPFNCPCASAELSTRP